ncbi:MAG: cytochrome d ubiquinol oxidase subunit II, partial [Desulfuromonadales bacterium]
NYEYYGALFAQLNPYSLLVGLTASALFVMHGVIYLILKTSGEVNAWIRKWVKPSIIVFIVMYVLTTLATLAFVPHMAAPFKQNFWLYLVPIVTVLVIANIPREIYRDLEWRAFLSSSAAIALLMTLYGIGMFPELIHSTNPTTSLTAMNASSSPKTLQIMLIIAAIGMPLVIAYTATIYWIFRGKVELEDNPEAPVSGY